VVGVSCTNVGHLFDFGACGEINRTGGRPCLLSICFISSNKLLKYRWLSPGLSFEIFTAQKVKNEVHQGWIASSVRHILLCVFKIEQLRHAQRHIHVSFIVAFGVKRTHCVPKI